MPVPHGVEVDDGVSKMNETEAAAACDAVSALLAEGQCTSSDNALVTLNTGQVLLIFFNIRFPKARKRGCYIFCCSE